MCSAHVHTSTCTHTHSHSMSSQVRSAALDPRGSLLTSDLGLENAPFRDHPNTWKRSQAVWVVCVCVSSSVCLCFHVHVSRLPACLECRCTVSDACIVRVYACINVNTCPLAVRCIATRCLHGHSRAPPTHPPCSHPCLLLPHPPPAPNPCSFFSLT